MIRIALYQPDIPQNTGTLLRLAACLNIGVDIIEPAGFVLDDRNLRRSGMDYLNLVERQRHIDFDTFDALRQIEGRRLILMTRHTSRSYLNVAYLPGDVLLLGRESSGVPESVRQRADLHVTIPQQGETRSLNVAVAAAMVTGEALRQIGGFPE